MKFLKKLGIASYIDVFAAVLILVSMFLSISSSNNLGYAIPELGLLITFSIISILGIAASIFLGCKFGNKLYAYLPLLISCVLSGFCFYFVLNSRTYLIGTLWATKLDQSNPYAVSAMGSGAPAFIIYCASMLIIAVSSFFNIVKEEKKTEA